MLLWASWLCMECPWVWGHMLWLSPLSQMWSHLFAENTHNGVFDPLTSPPTSPWLSSHCEEGQIEDLKSRHLGIWPKHVALSGILSCQSRGKQLTDPTQCVDTECPSVWGHTVEQRWFCERLLTTSCRPFGMPARSTWICRRPYQNPDGTATVQNSGRYCYRPDFGRVYGVLTYGWFFHDFPLVLSLGSLSLKAKRIQQPSNMGQWSQVRDVENHWSLALSGVLIVLAPTPAHVHELL